MGNGSNGNFWFSLSLLTWLQEWLMDHQHLSNMGSPTPLFPVDSPKLKPMLTDNAFKTVAKPTEDK